MCSHHAQTPLINMYSFFSPQLSLCQEANTSDCLTVSYVSFSLPSYDSPLITDTHLVLMGILIDDDLTATLRFLTIEK